MSRLPRGYHNLFTIMKNKRNWTVLPVYLILAVLLIPMSAITFYYNRILGIIELVVSAIIVAVVYSMALKFRGYVRTLSASAMDDCFSPDNKRLEAMKTPVAVCGENGELIAYNELFRKAFLDGEHGENNSIEPYLSGIDAYSAIMSGTFDVVYRDRCYTVFAREIDRGVLFEFIDDTFYKKTAQRYEETKKSVALIVFDNIEDFSAESDQEAAAAHLNAEDMLYRWATQNDILLRRIGENRYIAIFEERVLNEQIKSKFSLLDKIRAIIYNGRPATLSVGIGRGCDSLTESARQAKKALDMALGRGGDQVAVLTGADYIFFGGVAKGVEKSSKVRVRATAQQIAESIERADCVLVMGHKYSDLDSIGAAAGLYALITRKFGKPCHIVTDIEHTMARAMIDHLRRNHRDMFIVPELAFPFAGARTLMIIVDTHSPDFVENERLYKSCGEVVIIDHHRKMVNFIDTPGAFLHEPSASSVCELVTEVIGYLGEDCLTHTDAEALLVGIMLDTKNFVINTGVRTFEAAAFLRKKGADTVTVRNVFSNSLENYREKSRLVSSATLYNHCAITVADEHMQNSRVVCAQAADDLLSINDTYASFVISRIDPHTVNISARSFGKLNVQLVMEALGGGGHQTMAATQLKNVSLEEAKEKLLEVLKEMQ